MPDTPSASTSDFVINSPLALPVLIILFLYFFVRYFLVLLAILDAVIFGFYDLMTRHLDKMQSLRAAPWWPSKGKRRKILIHWLIATGLLIAFILIAFRLRWIEQVPN
ncbi:hypothetical protein ACMA5I_10185 [Paracoccaceae bacterium GXU_MW_L88]